MASSYAPLHLRSNYSLLTATATVDEILDHSCRLGLHAVALTDTNNLYGAVAFYKQARKRGIKPILGTEIIHETGRAVLLARNLAGYSNLCRIITRRNLLEDFAIDDALCKFQDGLFILTEQARLAEAIADRIDRRYLWLELAAPGRSKNQWNSLRECAERLGVGLVATPDAYFLKPADHQFHRVLVAIRENCLVAQVGPGETAHPE
ncbi:MAG: PHP domain-containing protein, partial [Phycisphaerae bacterium]|nr:PHP domain-containing protein [Phycisphaerae bacterium]